MREELRADVVRMLRGIAKGDAVGRVEDINEMADLVEQELELGDAVLCPSSKFATEQGYEDEIFTVLGAFWDSDTVALLAPDGYTVELVGWDACKRSPDPIS